MINNELKNVVYAIPQNLPAPSKWAVTETLLSIAWVCVAFIITHQPEPSLTKDFPAIDAYADIQSSIDYCDWVVRHGGGQACAIGSVAYFPGGVECNK